MKKGGTSKPGKKVDQKKVQKIVEDKTFGMKNKNKSKKVQQYINTVKTQTTQSLSANKVRNLPEIAIFLDHIIDSHKDAFE
jgi:hypothetical protein